MYLKRRWSLSKNDIMLAKKFGHGNNDKTREGFVFWALQTIRTLDYSYPGLFVLWVDYSYLERFVRYTIRTMDFSYYGLFVPSVKYSHKINC